MPNFLNFGQKILERDMTRQATQAHPGFVKMLQKVRMTGAPIPSLAQFLGFGQNQAGQRKAGLDKTMPGIAGAKQAAKMAPKMEPQAGKKYSMADLFGLR